MTPTERLFKETQQVLAGLDPDGGVLLMETIISNTKTSCIINTRNGLVEAFVTPIPKLDKDMVPDKLNYGYKVTFVFVTSPTRFQKEYKFDGLNDVIEAFDWIGFNKEDGE